MPITASTFAYSNAGATSAAPGQTVQSAVWNSVFGDIQTALAQLASNNYYGIVSNRNLLYANGSLEVWQRGTTISQAASVTAYTADRWYLITGANQASTVSRQAGLTDKSQFSATIQRTAAQTGTTVMTFGYPLYTNEINRFKNSKIYISAVVNAGANFSPASGALTMAFYTGTGAQSKRNAGGTFTGEVTVGTITTNLTLSTNTTISLSSIIVIPANTTQAELQFSWTPVGTAGAADTITIDDVQVIVIPPSGLLQNTSYDYVTFSESLLACQSSYCTTINYGTTVAQAAGLSGALGVISGGATRFGVMWDFPVRMELSAPSVVTYNPSGASANWQNFTTSASLAATIDTANSRGQKGILIYGATAFATDQLIYIHASADASI